MLCYAAIIYNIKCFFVGYEVNVEVKGVNWWRIKLIENKKAIMKAIMRPLDYILDTVIQHIFFICSSRVLRSDDNVYSLRPIDVTMLFTVEV